MKCGRYLLASSLTATLLGIRRVLARQGWAGEKAGPFEHPEPIATSASHRRFQRHFVYESSFPQPANLIVIHTVILTALIPQC